MAPTLVTSPSNQPRHARSIVLGSLDRKRLTGDEVVDRLRDVGGVVADPLDVLGAEQEMSAERNVARILHHVGEELAEQRGIEGVDLIVALPHVERRLRVLLGIGVENVLELRQRLIGSCAAGRGPSSATGLAGDRKARLPMFLARSPIRSRSPEMRIAEIVSRRSMATGWRRAIIRIARSSTSRCSTSSRVSAAMTLWASGVSRRPEPHGVGEHLLGDAAHLGDAAAQILQIRVERFHDMLGHGFGPPGRGRLRFIRTGR